MKTSLLLVIPVLAGVGCSAAVTTSGQVKRSEGAPQKEEQMTATPGKRLVEVFDPAEMSQIEIRCFSPDELVEADLFRALLLRSQIVSLPAGLADPFSYSPWFSGTFTLHGQQHSFQCFHGNRCKITLPSGAVLVAEVKEP